MEISVPHRVELHRLPSLFNLYRKIFFGRKPGWDQQSLPQIQVSLPNVSIDEKQVSKYAQICGFNYDGVTLPATYLHVIMFRLHAEIFTQDMVTFPLLGMIHLKNTIKQYRKLQTSDIFDCDCQLVESEVTDSGLEFLLRSQALVNGELVWESFSTYLYRIEGGKRVRPPRGSKMDFTEAQLLSIDADCGLKYARASGDYNLIHLHPFLAKRFGFDKVLAHGMWSKARCLALLENNIQRDAFSVNVEFKLPLFMPSDVRFNAVNDESEIQFELRDKKGKRPHLIGKVEYL
nr:MaoC/PaaZ C-terminal domain-containing protein [Parashewanella hymeniacidonis]